MPIELKCELCSRALGEINKGTKDRRSVLLCWTCWTRVKSAHDMAENALKDTPDFIKDLFGGK